MGLITISGGPGLRGEEVARLVAGMLEFELVTNTSLRTSIAEEFGHEAAIPEKAWAAVATSIVARRACQHHLVIAIGGAEFLLPSLRGVLRAGLTATEAQRTGALMLDHRLERPAAKALLRQLKAQASAERHARFPRSSGGVAQLVVSEVELGLETAAELIRAAAEKMGVREQGLLSAAVEARIQFQVRLSLAKYGLHPPREANPPKSQFSHSSEEVFANLLDFYRIRWEYEPRSFPVAWDNDAKVAESFTPDFYLPELDLYVELTMMKQSLVTRKNRKVKLLKSIYPDLNIQVFYQKDIQNLIFKHGLERTA